jgi:CRISPR-associated exonuclease Cas4
VGQVTTALLIMGLMVTGLVLLWQGGRRRAQAGLPRGRVVYLDASALDGPVEVLHDPKLGLSGRPDALVAESGGAIPVEVKAGRAPRRPHEAHLLQLAAYCRLAEARSKRRPSHGILQYTDRTFAVDFSPGLERRLEAVVLDIRRAEGRAPDRSHDSRARCRACGFRRVCDQRLRYNTGDA